MYMYYFVYSTTGVGEHTGYSYDVPSKWLDQPSECVWIVPGTVDPSED